VTNDHIAQMATKTLQAVRAEIEGRRITKGTYKRCGECFEWLNLAVARGLMTHDFRMHILHCAVTAQVRQKAERRTPWQQH